MRFSDLSISNKFWEIIDAANCDKQGLRDILSVMDQVELAKFHQEFLNATNELAAKTGSIKGTPISQENSEMMAGWIIARGKAFYASIYDHPESFPGLNEIDSDTNFALISFDIYTDRFGEDPPEEDDERMG